MNREPAAPAPLRVRPAWASLKGVAWRAAVIGLALHAAAVVSGAAAAAPSDERAILFVAAGSAAALFWSRARPVVVPRGAVWDRAALEAAAVGPAAALFALLLGWSAALGLPT